MGLLGDRIWWRVTDPHDRAPKSATQMFKRNQKRREEHLWQSEVDEEDPDADATMEWLGEQREYEDEAGRRSLLPPERRPAIDSELDQEDQDHVQEPVQQREDRISEQERRIRHCQAHGCRQSVPMP